MRKFFSILIVVLMLLSTSSSVLADETQGMIDLNAGEHNIVSEVMTFDELVAEYAKNEGVSIDVAQRSFFRSMAKNNIDPLSAKSKTYRTVSDMLIVTQVYKPMIHFYCETNEGSHHGEIVNVLNVNLERQSGIASYRYVGTIYYNLETPKCIYYTMDGDFYRYATVTITGGVSIGVGESANVTFGVSYTDKLYKTFYCSDRIHWGN